MSQDYRIIVQVEGGAGGSSSRKTSPGKSKRDFNAVSMIRNPAREALRSIGTGAGVIAGVALVGMMAKKAVDEGVAITAALTGDYRGQMSWNNTKATLHAMRDPLGTLGKALQSSIAEYKTNEAISINRELYGINDYRKGTK